MCLPLSAMEMQINLMEKKLVTWNSSRSQLPSEYSMWISIKKFILKKCVSVGKVRVINHCNTYHCNTYHCNTYHCITSHCNTEREPELRRGKIDESFFFLLFKIVNLLTLIIVSILNVFKSGKGIHHHFVSLSLYVLSSIERQVSFTLV